MTAEPGGLLHLISWNVNGSQAQLANQLEGLRAVTAELGIVALQEVRHGTVSQLRSGLHQLGLAYAVDNVDVAVRNERTSGELIASHWPFRQVQLADPVTPLPERILSATIESPWGAIEVHNVHIPDGSSYGVWKVETFERLFKRLAYDSPVARILCGDFNTPQAERGDGTIVTWGQDLDANGGPTILPAVRGISGKRWDRGERLILDTLAVHDLADVYRTLHGYSKQDRSWFWRGETSGHEGRRFDHVFASARLTPTSCQYLHEYRQNGLSDHSPIWVEFKPGSA